MTVSYWNRYERSLQSPFNVSVQFRFLNLTSHHINSATTTFSVRNKRNTRLETETECLIRSDSVYVFLCCVVWQLVSLSHAIVKFDETFGIVVRVALFFHIRAFNTIQIYIFYANNDKWLVFNFGRLFYSLFTVLYSH